MTTIQKLQVRLAAAQGAAARHMQESKYVLAALRMTEARELRQQIAAAATGNAQ
jgi:hypothetical protein